jgi:hypothetical protein
MTELLDKVQVPLSEVRAWATRKGFEVGRRGHISESIITRFNRAHKTKFAVSKNPKAVTHGS